MKYLLHCLIYSFMLITSLHAAEKPTQSVKQTTLGLYLTAPEAYEMKQNNEDILFIDVRTRGEVAFLGMPANVDANIPYMVVEDWQEWNDEKHNFKLSPNSNFLPYFNEFVQSKGLNKDSGIILICRSGNRSARAVNLLAQVGYSRVYTVTDGFEGDKDKNGHPTVNGWKNSGLPWSYKLEEEKMYMEF